MHSSKVVFLELENAVSSDQAGNETQTSFNTSLQSVREFRPLHLGGILFFGIAQ
jgi:hypothetical protein